MIINVSSLSVDNMNLKNQNRFYVKKYLNIDKSIELKDIPEIERFKNIILNNVYNLKQEKIYTFLQSIEEYELDIEKDNIIKTYLLNLT